MKENSLPNGDIAHFCKGLSLLLHAGISLGDGLFFMAEEETGTAAQMLKDMGQEVDAGDTLCQVMEKSGCFPAYVVGMVNVGEYTGHLEEALMALSLYYEERERMDRQMRSALTYPAVLLLLMLVVIGVLLISVLPVFDEVYATLGGSLSGLAGVLLHVGQILKAALPLLGILLAGVLAAVLLYFNHKKCRQKMTAVFGKKFGDRGIFKKNNDAHFLQALQMGYCSGLSVEEAATLAEKLVEDVSPAAARYQKCTELLSQGASLSEALKVTETLPVKECRMLELGIRGGSGEQVIGNIAERLSQEAAQDLEQSTAKIESAMVLTATFLVGMILLAVMLPLMNIMSAIG